MDQFDQWFNDFNSSDPYRKFQLRPVAYFCAEFAFLTGILRKQAPKCAGTYQVTPEDWES